MHGPERQRPRVRQLVIATSLGCAAWASLAIAAVAANPSVAIDDATACMDGSQFCYRPAALSVAAGTSVTVTNSSMAPHSLTRCTVSACGSGNTGNGSQSFDTGTLSPGSSGQVTLTQPGTYVYYCTVHGYSVMHGTFTVTAASASPSSPTPSGSSSPQSSSAATAPHVTGSAAGTGGVPTPGTGATPDLVAAGALAGSGLLLVAVARRRGRLGRSRRR